MRVSPNTKLTNLSKFMWENKAPHTNMLIRDTGVYLFGPSSIGGAAVKLDPLPGRQVQSFPMDRHFCARTTGSIDSIFCRANGGTVRCRKPRAR